MVTVIQLDHTADAGLRITAPTIEALFTAAAEGMFNLILDRSFYRSVEETMDVRLNTDSYTSLLQEWLSELLYFHATRKMIFSKTKIWNIAPESFEAIAEGFHLDEQQLAMATEIKAVTYHGLYVRQTQEGFEAEVIFDT